MRFKYIFGPVRSTRLGISLGIDMVGDNICSFDCIYCECGSTTLKTIERREYVNPEEVLEELKLWLDNNPLRPNYITLGGLGEPTLNSSIGKVIEGIKRLTSTPTAILTNSSLLWQEEVKDALSMLDVVLPSMDSMVEREFKMLNRPLPDLEIDTISQGLLSFASTYKGKIYLEILLCRGINDTMENLKRLKGFIHKLSPTRVDVVTLTRPGTSPHARPVDAHTLKRWRRELGAISSYSTTVKLSPSGKADISHLQESILSSLRRRPQKAEDLSAALGVPLMQIKHSVLELLKLNMVEKRILEGEEYLFVLREKECNSQCE